MSLTRHSAQFVIAKSYVYVDYAVSAQYERISFKPPLVMSLGVVYFPALIRISIYIQQRRSIQGDNIPRESPAVDSAGLKTMNPLQNRSVC